VQKYFGKNCSKWEIVLVFSAVINMLKNNSLSCKKNYFTLHRSRVPFCREFFCIRIRGVLLIAEDY